MVRISLLSLFIFSSFSVLSADLKLLFIGDSLTAGYGIEKESSFPALIGKQLEKEGQKVKIYNGSVSGSTSASAVSRLNWFKKAKSQVLVLALGANDGLRGIKISESRKHLKKAIVTAKKEKMKVLLVGMMMPPNYGPSYTKKFKSMFIELAKEEKVGFVPFLLDKVAANKLLNLADGIHPNEKGHEIMAKTVLEYLRPLLKL